GDVDDEARDLRLARKLPEHRAERLLDLGELLLVAVVVRRLALLALERDPERLLLLPRALELRCPVLDDHVPDQDAEHDEEDDGDHRQPEGERPAADVVDVERFELLDEVHPASSVPSSLLLTCFIVTVKLLWRAGPRSVVWICSTFGSASHSEPSMRRISADTRVLDCATPVTCTDDPLCRMLVR